MKYPTIEDITILGIPMIVWLIPITLAAYFWFRRQQNNSEDNDLG